MPDRPPLDVPPPGEAAHKPSTLALQKLRAADSTNDDGYRSIGVSVDGTPELFLRYDPSEVEMKVAVAVGFGPSGGAANTTVSLTDLVSAGGADSQADTPTPGAASDAAVNPKPDDVQNRSGGDSTNDDGYKSITVSLDGTIALFARYEPDEVTVKVGVSVGFRRADAAAAETAVDLGNEFQFVQGGPAHSGKPKPPKEPTKGRPTGPPYGQ